MKFVRSKCPTQSASTPGTAAIALDVGETLGGLDLGDHHRSRVECGDLGDDVAACVVVVRESERGAAAALRRIARARDDVRSLLGGADHRHHHAHRADIKCAGDEMIFAARHAHHRHERQSRGRARTAS